MAKDTQADRGAELLGMLKYALEEQAPDFNRLLSMQLSYDNKIDPMFWPTQSQLPTAQHFVAVENALKPAFDMCFPETNGVGLVAGEDGITPENLRNAEWALWTMVQYRMRLRQAAFRSLKDCFKMSVGYGLVEPFFVTPEQSTGISVVEKGVRRNLRTMGRGEVQRSVRYRYVSPGRVVPWVEGVDFNGPDATPVCFFYDPRDVDELEEMLTNKELLPEGAETYFDRKDAEDAANNAYRQGWDAFRLVSLLGGRKSGAVRTPPKGAPVKVPLWRVFEKPGRESWIIPSSQNSGKLVLEIDRGQETRVGLVKWSAWPDGDRWFPMSTPEADHDRAFAYDLFMNFMFDMMTRMKDSPRVINKSALKPGSRELPYGEDIFVETADVTKAASYLESPRMDPALPAVGDRLEKLGAQIWGTADFTQKNFTRGGTMAFQDLLNTMQARQQLSGIILEMGALTDVYEHVLVNLREMSSGGDLRLRRASYSPEAGRTVEDARTVTNEDLAHAYEMVLDPTQRRMLGGMGDQMRFQMWQALQENPNTYPDEVNMLLFPAPEQVINRVFRPAQEQRDIQEEQRQAELLATAAGGGIPAPGGGGGGGPLEGAIPGAEGIEEEMGTL